jgi:single-strand DNA-binding protein
MLNRIVIMGRLTRDPELRRTQNGTAVTSFSVAVDRDFKSRESGEKATDFIDVVAWRQTAEFVCQYFTKGRMAVVEGRLQIRDWKDKDGNNRRSAEVVADNIYFGDSKRDSADGGSFNQSQGYAQSFNQVPPQQPAYQAPQNVSAAPSDFSMLSDDDPDLPF